MLLSCCGEGPCCVGEMRGLGRCMILPTSVFFCFCAYRFFFLPLFFFFFCRLLFFLPGGWGSSRTTPGGPYLPQKLKCLQSNNHPASFCPPKAGFPVAVTAAAAASKSVCVCVYVYVRGYELRSRNLIFGGPGLTGREWQA